jgi:hypothetical protein
MAFVLKPALLREPTHIDAGRALGTRGAAYLAITAVAIGGSLGTIRRVGRIETIATLSIRLRRVTVCFYHVQGLLVRIRGGLTAFEDLCPEHARVRVVKSFPISHT